jgi:hypothetical protein
MFDQPGPDPSLAKYFSSASIAVCAAIETPRYR